MVYKHKSTRDHNASGFIMRDVQRSTYDLLTQHERKKRLRALSKYAVSVLNDQFRVNKCIHDAWWESAQVLWMDNEKHMVFKYRTLYEPRNKTKYSNSIAAISFRMHDDFTVIAQSTEIEYTSREDV